MLRHIQDWEFRYDLLHMLLAEGGDPNVEGRDGSVPLMVCLVPLINKDPLHHFTHTMKVIGGRTKLLALGGHALLCLADENFYQHCLMVFGGLCLCL